MDKLDRVRAEVLASVAPLAAGRLALEDDSA
jgi:hypothetical protein